MTARHSSENNAVSETQSPMIIRLTAISRTAETLSRATPSAEISHLRQITQSVEKASAMMGRVLNISPHILSGVKAARFASSCETVMTGVQRLIDLYGPTPDLDALETEIEAEMMHVTKDLIGLATAARADVTASLRTDIESTREVTSAWNVTSNLAQAERVTSSGQGELGSLFLDAMSKDDAHAVPTVVPKSTTSIMARIFGWRDPRTEHALETPGTSTFIPSDEDLETLFRKNEKRHDLAKKPDVILSGTFYKPELSTRQKNASYTWTHPHLDEMAIRIHTHKEKTILGLLETAPTLRTTAWDRLARAVSGDADALFMALTHKGDPDFKRELRKSVAALLDDLEVKAHAGVLLPISRIDDPVMRVAVRATLVNMGHSGLCEHRPADTSRFDPFLIRSALSEMISHHPGISLEPMGREGDVCLMSADSVLVPKGVAGALRSSRSQIFGVDDEHLHPEAVFMAVKSVHLSADCLNVVPDMDKNVKAFLAAEIKMREYLVKPVPYGVRSLETHQILAADGMSAEILIGHPLRLTDAVEARARISHPSTAGIDF